MEALKQLNQSKWRLKLHLYSNDLESVPESLYDLNNLETLNLSGNKLKVLSSSIGKLSKLKYLNVDYNCFSLIPPIVGQLPLEQLYVYGKSSLVVIVMWRF